MKAPSLPDRDALDLLPDATAVVHAEGRITAANRSLERLLGVAPAALDGAEAEHALRLYDQTGDEWWNSVQPLKGDVRLLRGIAEVDLLLETAGARTRPVLLTGRRVVGADGQLAALVLSLRRADRRRRLDAARSELVSTVSHELRSPLTSVKGFTKTLLARWDRFTDEQRRQMIATVHEDADRVTRLLSELLDVSRIDAGRLHLRRQMVDVEAAVRHVAARAGSAYDAGRDPRLVVDDLPALPRVYADPDKFAQVLANLVENGLKYGEGTVRVTAVERADDLLVVVSDQGHGLSTAHARHVFTKFFRPPGERRTGTGTGLGLYICRGIVEAHGGRIWAECPPEGTRFAFTVPLGGLELAGSPTAPDTSRPVRSTG